FILALADLWSGQSDIARECKRLQGHLTLEVRPAAMQLQLQICFLACFKLQSFRDEGECIGGGFAHGKAEFASRPAPGDVRLIPHPGIGPTFSPYRLLTDFRRGE